MVRLAKVWTDWRVPDDAAVFLLDLLHRITYSCVTQGDTGHVVREKPRIVVTFIGNKEPLASPIPDTAFGAMVTLNFKGQLPQFQCFGDFDGSSKYVQMGSHLCYFDESVRDPLLNAAPNDGISREWLPLDEVQPLGRAALIALEKVKSSELEPRMFGTDFDFTAVEPPPASLLDAARLELETVYPLPNGALQVELVEGASFDTVSARIPNGEEFLLYDLLAAGLSPHGNTNLLFIRPMPRSTLYKLKRLREELQLEQLNPAAATMPEDFQPSGGAPKDDATRGPKLPSFTDLLENKVDLDPVSGIVQPVRNESLLMSSTIISLAEAFIYDGPDSRLVQKRAGDMPEPPSSGKSPRRRAGRDGGPFASGFPARPESLYNDQSDLLWHARNPPLTFWVLGKCDASGEYKTEVCRRFANKLGLEWLKPQYLLELAVKTPKEQRTPLMARCVDQLQRGMQVSVSDALRLTCETMSSARCKTNGYVLDFPPLTPSDIEEVQGFMDRVYSVSGSTEVRMKEFLKDYTLPPTDPEPKPPEPPKPEPAEGEEGAAEGEGAEAGAGEGAEAGDGAEAAADAGAAGEGDAAEAGGEGAEGEAAAEEGEAPPVEEEPPETPVPNPWANVMPRRVVLLSMETDEVAGWRLAQLKARHTARALELKRLEEAGEDPPEEEEEEPVELPQLPEDPDELAAFFAGTANDVLQTMKEFVPVPSLEPPKKIPPLPDTASEPMIEDVDNEAFATGERAMVKTLYDQHKIPLLTLHADGRDPESTASLIEVVSGKFPEPQVQLPQPIEGAADTAEPTELLRAGLDERQASRRWSLWKQCCPVSLYEKKLILAEKEFAVDYAGYCFLFADAVQQRRFCNWPKFFLEDAPRINAPGMNLGYSIISPCGYRAELLAEKLRGCYDFDVVNVPLLIQQAMENKPSDADDDLPPADEGEDVEAVARPPSPEGVPRLTKAEQQAMMSGKPLLTETVLDLIGGALGIRRNITTVKTYQDLIKTATEELAAAAEAGGEPPEHIKVNDSGEPIVEMPDQLLVPAKGYVLVGWPESAAQLTALQEFLGVKLERMLMLKPGSEEAPDVQTLLTARGLADSLPLEKVLEAYNANMEELAGVEGVRIADVPLEAEEHEQLVHIRKQIDPFYSIVEDPTVGLQIPDPDEWTPPDPPADDEEKPEEPPERPVIPWGTTGPYCAVTLKEDFWLYPGSKEFQHVFSNRVYAVASEQTSNNFKAEPIKYIPKTEPLLPPPRILVSGPTGSGVEQQCELLAKAYRIPVIKLEEEWLKRVAKRLEDNKEKRKKEAQAAALLEPLLTDDQQPIWPPGWDLPPEKSEEEGEEAAGDAEESKEPEEDGLEDEQREALFVEAMRDVLGSHIGACVINGTFFGDLGNEDMSPEMKTARSIQNLLVKARRLPDLVVILKIKNDLAAKSIYDFAEIDRVYEQRVKEYQELVAKAEEQEEDPPPPPEDLELEADEDEKESDRILAKFVEKKKAEQGELAAFAEALKIARAPFEKVSADRGADVTLKGVRWYCRPFMEQRSSLLVRYQAVKASPMRSADALKRSLVLPSRFGNHNPLFVDMPLFVGKPTAFKQAVDLRSRLYYPRNESEQEQLLVRPQDFMFLPQPSCVSVNPCIAICGPPLSGKTTLAKQVSMRTGAVYLSVPEVISQLCDKSALPFALSRSIMSCMRKGNKIPAASIVEALRHRIAAPDVLTRGWVLDDFPLSAEQAKALTQVGIMPHKLLVINVPEATVFKRARDSSVQGTDQDEDLVQREVALQRQRLDAYMQNVPPIHAYYGLTFGNVCEIDGTKGIWAMYDRALEETSASISRRLEYYRRTADGKAACIYGMCFHPDRIQGSESAWGKYCPVTLTLGNELVLCKDPRYIVEHKGKVYWIISAEYVRLFLEDPESFLAVPLPAAVPTFLPLVDRNPAPSCMLDGYCPVALVDRGELVKAAGGHIVQHQGKFWSLEGKESCNKFMRRPMRYVQRAKLPAKKPALRGTQNVALLSALTKGGKDGKGLEPAEMLTFMQASVAEVICQALVDAGERRPLYPGKTVQESALLFIVNFLRARNVLNTEMTSGDVKTAFEDFLSDCALPAALKELTQRKEAHEAYGEGAWTSSDTRMLKELTARFDSIFCLPP